MRHYTDPSSLHLHLSVPPTTHVAALARGNYGLLTHSHGHFGWQHAHEALQTPGPHILIRAPYQRLHCQSVGKYVDVEADALQSHLNTLYETLRPHTVRR